MLKREIKIIYKYIVAIYKSLNLLLLKRIQLNYNKYLINPQNFWLKTYR